ncbi:uncharacterized protein K489DRAFT_314252 [Dissoconium aciculare CBS 342.82]|uniref:F-box domain-containing protein n=1 Tax=Dissoconium aciculare CBS 342.82 TaxID=1314786 RepID=A0A6J3MBQ2_9PEZI|nr:uncharacterized protein K489DRAFT_314252 [Dissoconium aciculare CBS 342.82]KAF1825054.1 hypothetical protein K489DRAFT_314252 [Dissoconium aciculare CBS 342.82]
MPLLSLPLELQQHVAGCLEPSSLRNFSLTSIACHEASLPAIFERICITVHDPESLQRHVNALREALSDTNSFSCVRQITIKGALRLAGKETERWPLQSPWSFALGVTNSLLDEVPICHDGMYVVSDENVIEALSDEDVAWLPLVNLLEAEVSLEDLVFDCRSQFPPSLLRILHARHPRCRLHLTFKFRTLLSSTPNAYEMELATSPCLSTIKAICSQRDSDGTDDFNLEALIELVAGLAPNLSKVVVLNLFPGGSMRSNRPRNSWQGLPGFTPRGRGSLKSLSLKGHTQLKTPQVLQDWARHVDFTCLRHLTLGGALDLRGSGLSGDTMQWIVQTQSFPLLKSLCVQLTRDNAQVERPLYREQAITFFRSFESLEQLSIDGPIDFQIKDAALAHHGKTLKKLSLHPFEQIPYPPHRDDKQDLPFHFTKDCILQLQAQCPILEELTILVKRNMSKEADLYRCFGGMRNLRALSLILDCSNWRVTRDPTYKPDFDEQDREPVEAETGSWLKRGELKATLINCAVDEALACSIWKTISQNKTGKPLERLKLWPTGAFEYGTGQSLPTTFIFIELNLTRSWSFERDPRDDTEDFTVTELQRERRLALEEQFDIFFSGHRQDHGVWEVFHSIWPPRAGSKDFRDDWSSFPLG